jgi:hypothetical protein
MFVLKPRSAHCRNIYTRHQNCLDVLCPTFVLNVAPTCVLIGNHCRETIVVIGTTVSETTVSGTVGGKDCVRNKRATTVSETIGCKDCVRNDRVDRASGNVCVKTTIST